MGITQKELAERAKISPITLNRIEKGHQSPQGLTLEAIADVLKCSIKEIVTDAALEASPNITSDVVIDYLIAQEAKMLALRNELTLMDQQNKQLADQLRVLNRLEANEKDINLFAEFLRLPTVRKALVRVVVTLEPKDVEEWKSLVRQADAGDETLVRLASLVSLDVGE